MTHTRHAEVLGTFGAFASGNGDNCGQEGLTYLEYYAGLAMQGLLAARTEVEVGSGQRDWKRPANADEIAELAVHHAKSLLVALTTEMQKQRAREKTREVQSQTADTVVLTAPTEAELAAAELRAKGA